MYQLIYNNPDNVRQLSNGAIIPTLITSREGRRYQIWLAAGNTPQPADEPTPEEVARQEEVDAARPFAKQWLLDHQAAIDFMRLSPDEQKIAIDGMATAALKTIVWYLVVIVSALIKERYL